VACEKEHPENQATPAHACRGFCVLALPPEQNAEQQDLTPFLRPTHFCRRILISAQTRDSLPPPRQKRNSPARIKPIPANVFSWFAQLIPRLNMIAAAIRPKTARTRLKISCPDVGDFPGEVACCAISLCTLVLLSDWEGLSFAIFPSLVRSEYTNHRTASCPAWFGTQWKSRSGSEPYQP
jgi:hypothetical protein